MEASSSQLKQILVVCTGNTCRSPMAEGWLNKKLAGTRWVAESAGLGAVNGSMAAPEAVEAMAEVGVDISRHGSRMFTERGMAGADIILAMTRGHLQEIVRRFPEAEGKTRLLNSFGPGGACDVEDPIGLPIDAYRKTRDELIQALGDFLLHLVETGQLRRGP
jgi:protein-tyrosine-phosphatase